MERKEIKSEKVWTPLFIQLFIANGLMTIAQQMMNTVVSKYANYIGASAAFVGVVTSIYALTALIFKLFSGPVIDTYNRRIVFAASMFVMALSFLGLALSTNVQSLIASRLLLGVAQAFTSTCALAVAADALPKSKFSEGMGIFTLSQAASQAVGPSIALFLVSLVGYQATFYIGSGITIIGVIIASRLNISFVRTKKLKINLKSVIAKEAILPACIVFFISLSYFVITSFIVVYADEVNISNIGLFFTVYAGSMLFTRPFIGRLTDKYGLVKVLVPSLIAFISSLILISYSHSLIMILLAGFVSAFGFGASVPIIQSLSMKIVPIEKRGAGSSTTFMGTDLGSLLGPIIAGRIADAVGYSSMWRIMVIPTIIAILIVIVFRRYINHAESEFKMKQEMVQQN